MIGRTLNDTDVVIPLGGAVAGHGFREIRLTNSDFQRIDGMSPGELLKFQAWMRDSLWCRLVPS